MYHGEYSRAGEIDHENEIINYEKLYEEKERGVTWEGSNLFYTGL